MAEQQTQIKDLKGIVRRGKKAFLITVLSIFVLGVIIAFVLPPIYRSQSTILIETQQIPQEYVQSSVTGYVEQRLQMITQRVMSRSRLMEIIDRFNLYPDMRDRYTTEEIIDEMRDDIDLETISADVIDTRTGRPTSATIAFSLSYEGKDPSTVQKVANTLASIYMEQNLKTREEQASETTAFLQQERDALKKQIDDIQNRISRFKEEHAGALPENTAINLQSVARLESQLDQVEAQIRSLQERKIYLTGQIATVEPLNPIVTEDGKMVEHPKERLKALRLELITLQSTLSDKHPDIKRLKKEIAKLEARTGETDDAIAKVRRLSDLKGQLAAMKGRLGPRHPDVIRLSKEVDLLSKEVEKLHADKTSLEVSEESPDNPAYINLKTQIATTESDIRSYTRQAKQIKEKIDSYLAAIEKTPAVEKDYNDMISDLESAKLKYNEVMNKLMEARIAQGMEESQRGERFTIIDPAQFPEKPYKPNRIAIILIGFVLALGAGTGIVAVHESMDSSVKTADELADITGLPVFSTISLIETDEEKAAKRKKTWLWIAVSAGVLVLALVIIHLFVMPLDIAWIKIERRLMIL
ncbi:MAG: lipopolysaccharide biosynthesis protein [Deltaproteobacteria bacterium]|nr:MAG: lipopolysaccharide biosynthesis protein [Deltaproteobacteria bacterium]